MPLRGLPGCQRGSSFGAQMPLRAASPRSAEATLVPQCRCGLPDSTACKHRAASSHRMGTALVLKNATAGCQPALRGGSFGAQMPLRAASPHRVEALFGARRCRCNPLYGPQPAPRGSSLGAQMPLHASSPNRVEAAWVLKPTQIWCSTPLIQDAAAGCQPAPRGSSFLVQKIRCGPPACTAWKKLGCSIGAAVCQQRGSSFAAQMPLRGLPRCLHGGRLPARTTMRGSSFGANAAARAARLPARAAWKQLWCSNAAAGRQPAPRGSSSGASMPMLAASPHRVGAALAPTEWPQRCSNAAAEPAHTAWK